jgi:hypothetical protein
MPFTIPEEQANRIRSLDAAITDLVGTVDGSNASNIDSTWRTSFSDFLRRWQAERDAYASWTPRLLNVFSERLGQFEKTFRWWSRDFQRRTGERPKLPEAATQHDLSDDLEEAAKVAHSAIPEPVWWILGAAALLWVSGRKGA